MNHNAYGIRNTVIYTEKFSLTLPQLHPVSRSNRGDRGLIEESALFQFDIDQTLRQASCIDGWKIQYRQDVGEASNMVFVAMGDEDATYTVFLVVEVACIRDNQVYTEHFLIGEHDPSINNNDVIAIFDDHHILSDFP